MFVRIAKRSKESALHQVNLRESASETRLAFSRKHLAHKLSPQRLTVPRECYWFRILLKIRNRPITHSTASTAKHGYIDQWRSFHHGLATLRVASNSGVNIPTKMPTATSSPCQKLTCGLRRLRRSTPEITVPASTLRDHAYRCLIQQGTAAVAHGFEIDTIQGTPSVNDHSKRE
jgi:hypothetical protein